MSDVMRWRYGDTNPVASPVLPYTVIEIGDLVWLDCDDAKPADKAFSKKEFHIRFLGVAMQRSRSGEIDPIRVATTGVFEFIARLASCSLGVPVGPWWDSDTDCLANQRVQEVDSIGFAVGRIAKYVGTPADCALTESVLVDIRSTIMTDGPFLPAT